MTENDVVSDDCVCAGTPIVVFDCPELEVNIGDPCNDGDELTENDVIGDDCFCAGTPIVTYDCSELEANFGDPCIGDPTTIFNALNADCECVGEASSAGEICGNPIEIDAIGNPTNYYLTGDDAVYAYTPTEDQIIDITVTEHGSRAGVFVFTGCPFESTIGGDTTSFETIDLVVEQLPVQAGITYYIVISTYTAPQSTGYTLSITEFIDCEGTPSAGIPAEDTLVVCANEEFVISVTGVSISAEGLESIWQSSPAGENNWTAIEGAIFKYHTVLAGIETNTDYRYVSTCSFSAEIAMSNVIEVSLSFNKPECYCIAGNPSAVESITYVNFGDIDNISSASYLSAGYEDFTNQSTTVSPGESIEIILKGHTGGDFTNYFTVFIDWNQNGILDDDGEIYQIGSIKNSNGLDTVSLTGNIEVPIDALPGNTRMRIRKDFAQYFMDPCANLFLGQSEDYTLTVLELEPCTSVPSAGTPDEDMLIVCFAEEFSLSVSGVSDLAEGLESIWQSSLAGENNWTIIEGAFSKSLTLSDGIQASTDYRYLVSCSFSGENGVSEIIQVILNPNLAECICTPSVSTTIEPITYVNFGDIDNTSDASSSDGYEDFTDQTATLNPGEFFEITLKGNTNGKYSDYYTVFIDWNQNGILDDAGEVYEIGSIYHSNGADGKSISENIVVPLNAVAGNTWMRIRKNRASFLTDPCDTNSYGQTEDYTVVITEYEVCSVPSAGIPTEGTLLVCFQERFNLSVFGATDPSDGLERNWQTSPAGENNWLAIEGASSKWLSIPNGIEVDTDYRFVCSYGDETDASEIIHVTLNESPTECVCIPSILTEVRPIVYVNIGDIDNASYALTDDPYEDFRDQITQLNPGEPYVISLNGHTGGAYMYYYTVFIDWNQNGILDDAGEVYRIGFNQSSNGTNGQTVSGIIDVPLDAADGSARMRIRSAYGYFVMDPCLSIGLGQTEDYTVMITGLDACTGTPSAGTPDEDLLLVCLGEKFTVSVSEVSDVALGLERSWQSSPTGENDWSDIEGAYMASLTISTGIEADTDYRYVVTCSYSDETDVSDVIQVSLNLNEDECFCVPSFSTNIYPITQLHFGDIQNISDVFPIDANSVAYEDFTDQSTEVIPGEIYQINSGGYTSGNYTSYFTVFIDWNQNGILDDAGEVYPIGTIKNSNGIDHKATFGNIAVPLDATLGSTRMRVLKTYLANPTDPCGSYLYGQAEDYTIDVITGIWCPNLDLFVGDACEDGNDKTTDDIVNENCECAGTPVPDCVNYVMNPSTLINLNTPDTLVVGTCLRFHNYSVFNGITAGYEYKFAGAQNNEAGGLAYVTAANDNCYY